jgi:hypothetical protein
MAELRPHVREDEDGAAWLTLSGTDKRTRDVFLTQGWDGNGYDWGEVGQALALMKMPDRFALLDFDPEGDYLSVLAPTRAVMDELAGWLQAAIDDTTLLEGAIRYAEENGLDGCTHRGPPQ